MPPERATRKHVALNWARIRRAEHALWANCFACHEPAKAAWDMICEGGYGCIPIPLTPVMLRALQNTDQRCPAMELPKEQIDALAASRAPPPEER